MLDETTGLEVLDPAECRTLLASHYLGRLAFATPNGLEVLPVNYRIDGHDVVVLVARDSLIAAHVPDHEVAFEIDHADALTHSGWSVVVHGTGEAVDDPAEVRRLGTLRLVPWGLGRPGCWLRVRPRRITGRRIVHRGRPAG